MLEEGGVGGRKRGSEEERKKGNPKENLDMSFMKTQKHYFFMWLNSICYIKTYTKNNFGHLNKRKDKFKRCCKGNMK